MFADPTAKLGAGNGLSDRTARTVAIEDRLARLAECGPAAINERIAEIDSEWSAGRMTKSTAGIVILVGVGLTVAFGPWFGLIPAIGGLALMQYLFSRQSWLSDGFESAGYRPGCEIEREKTALKVLRGDFQTIPTVHDIEDRDAIARLEGEGGIVTESDTAKVAPREAVKEVLQATET